MRVINLLIIIVLLPFLICSCAEEYDKKANEIEDLTNVRAPFGAGSITLHISSDSELNSWNDISNSCSLLILQSSDKKTLQEVMNNPLLIKDFFNNVGKTEGILKVDKYTAMPGQEITLHIDRSEGTRYVSVIAGYYPFPVKQHMLLFDIPVEVKSVGWWNKTMHTTLIPLLKKIHMGKETINFL